MCIFVLQTLSTPNNYCNSGILISTLYSSSLSESFMLKIRVHTYVNEFSAAASKLGNCCDDSDDNNLPTGLRCKNLCDNYFVFCLREFNASHHGPGGHELVDLTNCSHSNRAQTGLLKENSDNFLFTIGKPFPQSPHHSEVFNPVQLQGNNWTVSEYIYYVYVDLTSGIEIKNGIKGLLV